MAYAGGAHPGFSVGEVVAPRAVTPEAFAAVLDDSRRPLVLAPGSEWGWFGGHALVAWDPLEVVAATTLAEAADLLEAAYRSPEPVLVAALATYDGHAAVARYGGAMCLGEGGWVPWGRAPGDVAEIARLAQQHLSEPLDEAVPLLGSPKFDIDGREYRASVEAVRSLIASGDVYVLNLTCRLGGSLAVSSRAAFGALRARADAEMSAFIGGWPGPVPWLASASPERFIRITPGEEGAALVAVSPIKGTTGRGRTADDDARMAAALRSDEKELAEHLMIVDLERNDIGVACMPGTVHVDPLYEVRTTPYCHQLVSTVHGTLRSDSSLSELIASVFPCGSVTGAPKRAAMRIIDELERSARRAYCGSLLVAVPGELDSSVIIRSLEGSAEEPQAAVWGAGCGITYESDPAAEWLEVLLKASPVLADSTPLVSLRETMRVVSGRIPLLDRHLARLAMGGCGPTLLARVRYEVASIQRELGGDTRALRLGVTVCPDRSVEALATDAPSSLTVAGGVAYEVVEVDDTPPVPAGAAKPAARRFWDRAHRTATARGAHQAVLATASGLVLDGSTANVWVVRDGAVFTPPAPPAVAGVSRELVFDITLALGIDAEERPITVGELATADEVFFSNAYGGVAAARGRSGPITAAIAAAFEERMAGG